MVVVRRSAPPRRGPGRSRSRSNANGNGNGNGNDNGVENAAADAAAAGEDNHSPNAATEAATDTAAATFWDRPPDPTSARSLRRERRRRDDQYRPRLLLGGGNNLASAMDEAAAAATAAAAAADNGGDAGVTDANDDADDAGAEIETVKEEEEDDPEEQVDDDLQPHLQPELETSMERAHIHVAAEDQANGDDNDAKDDAKDDAQQYQKEEEDVTVTATVNVDIVPTIAGDGEKTEEKKVEEEKEDEDEDEDVSSTKTKTMSPKIVKAEDPPTATNSRPTAGTGGTDAGAGAGSGAGNEEEDDEEDGDDDAAATTINTNSNGPTASANVIGTATDGGAAAAAVAAAGIRIGPPSSASSAFAAGVTSNASKDVYQPKEVAELKVKVEEALRSVMPKGVAPLVLTVPGRLPSANDASAAEEEGSPALRRMSDPGAGLRGITSPPLVLRRARFNALGLQALATVRDFVIRKSNGMLTEEHPKDLYSKLGVELGKGQYGEVHLVKCKKTKEVLAIKAVKLKRKYEPFITRLALREVKCLELVQGHPNIVGFRRSFYTQMEGVSYLYIVTEFITGVSLAQYIREHGRLTPEQTARVVNQVISGISHCHSKFVIHRDVKPGNIVCASVEPFVVKLIDFGISKVVEDLGTASHSPNRGTFFYMPPEAKDYERKKETLQYDSSVDVYAAGVTTLECGFGSKLTKNGKEIDLSRRYIAELLHRTRKDLPGATGILSKMLSEDPTERPSCDVILADPWVRSGMDELDLLRLNNEMLSQELGKSREDAEKWERWYGRKQKALDESFVDNEKLEIKNKELQEENGRIRAKFLLLLVLFIIVLVISYFS